MLFWIDFSLSIFSLMPPKFISSNCPNIKERYKKQTIRWKGIEQGIEQVAKQLLQAGIEFEKVVSITELSIKQVRDIQKQQKKARETPID